mmetsp:Transcript_32811/g.93112  ORF Transcript_32811/g.93112 Transcript_32811/m.93112 type:complete len:214 (+) Transcript_32811:162-803(+)|eukprot:CAMPEP_0117680928 /NCGR_PEP_ID=MMETSP0804-20121206/18654_1 /TAXON_ID=1074897 /ORGANISM="Tetraselmis astigmatica, Strain CCMP880" /LENGTH=213 /DNA_ID=CAMNT_0005490539 /DNA_START=109 /DNA_END=750 /DNA_ORIENTATION=-
MGNAHPQSIKLTYFDMAGVAEPIRMAFWYGNVKFEDERLTHDQWKDLKPSTPYGSLPVLTVDGQTFAQTSAILRYAGKLSGLYPSNPLGCMKVDELMDAVEDVLGELRPSLREADEAKKMAARKVLVSEVLPMWLEKFAKGITANGSSGYLYGDSLTVADLRFNSLCSALASGRLDGIPVSLVNDNEPIARHMQLVKEHPKISKYLEEQAAKK